MTDCIHLTRGHGVWRSPNKPDLLIHRCDRFGSCVEEPDDRISPTLHVCINCLFSETSEDARCAHLGPVIRQQEADLCGLIGQSFDVRACAVHGECSRRRLCRNQEIQACASCDDFMAMSRHPRQVYSGGLSDPNVPMTPIPIDLPDDVQKHLIYHIWPRSGTGVWRWNVEQLVRRIDLFDGVRTIGVSLSDDADTLSDVQGAFRGHRIDNWIVRPNNSRTGECQTFRPMLQTLPKNDGLTFYGHAKGVRHDPPLEPVYLWVDLMLRSCLDEWDRCLDGLRQYPTVGIMKDVFHFVRENECHNWHFPGTHFWFRNSDVFSRPEWSELSGNYYSVELWPCKLFKSSEAFCLFGAGHMDPYQPVEMNALYNSYLAARK